jgi:hypothetical protein
MFLPNSRKFLAKAAENWPAKVLSIGLAIVIFVFHRMSSLESRFFFVPLNVEVSSSLIPSSSYDRMVRVSIKGDANSIYPILEDDIEAFIDLRMYTSEGTYRSPVQIRKKGTALGVEPLEISVDPMEITLDLDRRISKYVPITPNIRGNLAGGYDLISHSLSPTQVVVDGPMNLVGGLTELFTEYIDLDGRSADFSVTVNILNRDPLLTIRGNGVTEFHGFVSRMVAVRNIDNIPLQFTNLDGAFSAEADIKTGLVRLEGSQEILDAFTPPPGFLFLDCVNINKEGTYVLPVQIELPRELTLIRSEPRELSVTVKVRSEGG